MGATIYEVIVESNAVAEFGKIATAAKAMDTTVRKSTTTKGKNNEVIEDAAAPVSKLSKALNFLSNTQKKNNSQTIIGTYLTTLFGRANKSAGLSVGSLSLRINTALIPVLFSLVTAMVPVVAGLLAIASAALVAGGAVAGVVGVGVIAWAKRFKTSSGGYGGARRPYSSGEDADFGKELLKGFSDVLSDPAIKNMIDYAVGYTQELFGKTLPDAFKTFLLNVDFDEVKKVMVLFTTWLPVAAESLAVWGSQILEIAGARSLNLMNKFFKYLAGGIKNTSIWLKKGGFEQLENLSRQIGEVISDLMVLGKKALPVLLDAFSSIYPNPIKPALEYLGDFFGWFTHTKYIKDATFKLIGLALSVMFLDAALRLVALTISFLAKGFKIIGGILAFVGTGFMTLTAGVASAMVAAGAAFALFGAGILLTIASFSPKFRALITNLGIDILQFLDTILEGIGAGALIDMDKFQRLNSDGTALTPESLAAADGGAAATAKVLIAWAEDSPDKFDELITTTVDNSSSERTGAYSAQRTILAQ